MRLVQHPHTKQHYEKLLASKPHAILITGNDGSGKRHTAITLASEILGSDAQAHPYFIHIVPEGNSFTVEQIRDLHSKMKLKTTGTGQIRRVALLQDVHTMTVEAQNALLKLLEEPPEDTMLILTAQGDQTLKPTIYSRVQRLHIKPILEDQLDELNINSNDRQRLFGLSGGDIGLLLALADNNNQHPLVSSIEDAKRLITAPVFERLCRVDELSRDKENLGVLLVAFKRISSAALKASIKKHDTKAKDRWLAILSAVHDAEKMLQANVNTKLLLSELFLAF